MFLSERAFNSLEKTFINSDIAPLRITSLRFHLKVASLLHDIGHAPFSHLGEKFFPKKEKLINSIKSMIDFMNLNIDLNIFSVGSKHELMSCYIILNKYSDILRSYFAEKEIELNLELVCRCIAGKTFDIAENWPEDVVIKLLNSRTIDTDKLDYLMRDAHMTGVDVSPIDSARLFNNIWINPNTYSITFHHNALSVLQNIIDARDAMYLWVYNHHITVYTDFIFEYYLKHLIINYESNNRFIDKLNPYEFFSCKAIADNYVSDSDLWSHLKIAINSEGDNENISKYTKTVGRQLFERNFLKPLWKTIYQFNEFINRNVQDDTIKSDLIKRLCDMEDYSTRAYVAKELIANCGLNLGEIFIVPRSNKFYSLDSRNSFTVHISESDKNVSSLLPQRDFSKLYENVAFYLFCDKNKIKEVEKQFIEIAKRRLPDSYTLQDISTTPEWLK
jgi:HD superfamily phosphohydrolase